MSVIGRTEADRERLLALHRLAQSDDPESHAAADEALHICEEIIAEGDETHPFWLYAVHMTGAYRDTCQILSEMVEDGTLRKSTNREGRTVYSPGDSR